MDNLEEECEEALCETCEARSIYPLHCAKELEKCIKVTNEIYTTKIITTPVTLDVPAFTNEQCAMLQKNFFEVTDFLKTQVNKLQEMIDKIDNLTSTLDQMKREEFFEINQLLQS